MWSLYINRIFTYKFKQHNIRFCFYTASQYEKSGGVKTYSDPPLKNSGGVRTPPPPDPRPWTWVYSWRHTLWPKFTLPTLPCNMDIIFFLARYIAALIPIAYISIGNLQGVNYVNNSELTLQHIVNICQLGTYQKCGPNFWIQSGNFSENIWAETQFCGHFG